MSSTHGFLKLVGGFGLRRRKNKARAGIAGRVLDSAGIRVSTPPGEQGKPAVALDGTSCVLAREKRALRRFFNEG